MKVLLVVPNSIVSGKYDHLIKSGKELVTLDFYLDPRYSQHVLAWENGVIHPAKVTES